MSVGGVKTVQGASKPRLPSISEAKKQQQQQRKERMLKQKSRANIKALESAMDRETLDQLHKLIKHSDEVAGASRENFLGRSFTLF